MSKHTPGPWHIEVHEKMTSIEGKHQTIACDVSNCDARLIAAAPDLLEVLKDARDYIESLGDVTRSANTYEKHRDALMSINEIIAEAEGA